MSTTPKRRRGCWTYRSDGGGTCDPGWNLDGTSIVLDFDPLHSGCAIPGAYVLYGTKGRDFAAVDHYLDGAMEWVEQAVKAGEVTPKSATA